MRAAVLAVLGAFVLPGLAAPGPALALEGPAPSKAQKGGQFPTVDAATDDEAKSLAAALEAALKTNDENTALGAVRPLVSRRHKSFLAILKPLISDSRVAVAALAAEALGSQGDPAAVPLLSRVLAEKPDKEEKKGGFLRRGAVKAAAIESLGRLGASGVHDAVRDLAEDAVGPGAQRLYAPAMLRAAVRYFGVTKEKRAVTFLIALVDEPVPADPNSGTNPPAEYWKARYDSWKPCLPEVVWALKEITGMEFESGRRWKAWYEEEGKKAGMK
jgi:hypothetical protein